MKPPAKVPAPAPASAAPPAVALHQEAFDLLSTMVAVAEPDGRCTLANATLEDVVSQSRRTLQRSHITDWFVDSSALQETLSALARNEVGGGRFEALLRRAPHAEADALRVRVHVSPLDATGRVLLEMQEIQAQSRQDREERALDQAQSNKELIRNLAHEIKNPLGGIRGAAQLLEMDLPSRELREYTQVIITEADRLQALVDRLLAPHRRPHVVGDVNIHEVCERVRLLVLAEYPRGLHVQRDYDTSIPEFRGDAEQLIQAVLNIAHNATQALAARIANGDARLTLRTRVARQAVIGKQRYRLALELRIQDNGPGVPEELKERIFHPLVSGREGGSGLGLTLAQTFVQQHLGTIEFDSTPGRTVFTLLIPLP